MLVHKNEMKKSVRHEQRGKKRCSGTMKTIPSRRKIEKCYSCTERRKNKEEEKTIKKGRGTKKRRRKLPREGDVRFWGNDLKKGRTRLDNDEA